MLNYVVTHARIQLNRDRRGVGEIREDRVKFFEVGALENMIKGQRDRDLADATRCGDRRKRAEPL